MTNYTRLETAFAAGGNAVIAGDSTPSARAYLGPDSTWNQRRAFEWGALATSFWHAGDAKTAEYCFTRYREVVEREATGR